MSNDPLHGKKLADILEEILAFHNGDWNKIAEKIPVRCFQFDPSIKSALTFLRKTPWARTKVENMYLFTVVRKQQKEAENLAKSQAKNNIIENTPTIDKEDLA